METIILTEEKIKEIAEKYKSLPDQFESIDDSLLHLFRKLIVRQFNYLSKFLYLDFVDEEPYQYKSIDEVLMHYHNGYIKVNTTGNDSLLWGKVYNLMFRGIHDYIHCKDHLDFTLEHEIKAYHSQVAFSHMFDFPYKNFITKKEWEIYEAILRSEIIYQAYYKTHFGEFHVPEQKIILVNLID